MLRLWQILVAIGCRSIKPEVLPGIIACSWLWLILTGEFGVLRHSKRHGINNPQSRLAEHGRRESMPRFMWLKSTICDCAAIHLALSPPAWDCSKPYWDASQFPNIHADADACLNAAVGLHALSQRTVMMYVYTYVYIYMYVWCVCIYIYIYLTLAYEIDICLVNVVFYVFRGFICLT